MGKSRDCWCGSINIQTALEQYRQLVIVGDPGSGKSTFLKFIALMIARAVLAGDPVLATERLNLEPPLPIPIFLSCWDFSDFIRERKNTTEEALLDFITERLAVTGAKLPVETIKSMLTAGSCCLLFDGLDEVPTEQGRALVSRLFEKFVTQYDKNRYVVTSRVRAYSGDTILRGGFTRCNIQEFNQDDRSEFLRNWFSLLFKVPREEVMTPGSDSQKALDDLQTAIENKERIQVLAVNPLLLTVIAIVHWNRKRLPEQRVDLYDECVDVLLGQRKEAERIQRAREDTSSEVRRCALALLATRENVKGFALRILTRDLDRIRPYLDPQQPITEAWVKTCSDKLHLSPHEIREMFRALAKALPLKLEIAAQSGEKEKET